MKKFYILVVGLLLAGIVLSCASSEGDAQISAAMGQDDPTGSWVLTELPKEVVIIPEGITLELAEEDGILFAGGNSGVNQYRGRAEFKGEDGSFSFGMMVTTRKMGPDMSFETTYLKTLGSVDRYRLADDYLFLYSGGELVAVFLAG